MQMNKLYTVKEISDILEIPVQTIRLYVREGRLEAIKIGRRYRILAESVEKMILEFTKNLNIKDIDKYMIMKEGNDQWKDCTHCRT